MVLSQIIAVVMVSQLLSTALSAYLTSINPWIPLTAALGCSAVAFSVGLFLPETLHHHASMAKVADSDQVNGTSGNQTVYLRKNIQGITRQLTKALGIIRQNYNVLFMMLGFLVSNIGKSMTAILLQYASKKLGWTIGKVRFPLTNPTRQWIIATAN